MHAHIIYQILICHNFKDVYLIILYYIYSLFINKNHIDISKIKSLRVIKILFTQTHVNKLQLKNNQS